MDFGSKSERAVALVPPTPPSREAKSSLLPAEAAALGAPEATGWGDRARVEHDRRGGERVRARRGGRGRVERLAEHRLRCRGSEGGGRHHLRHGQRRHQSSLDWCWRGCHLPGGPTVARRVKRPQRDRAESGDDQHAGGQPEPVVALAVADLGQDVTRRQIDDLGAGVLFAWIALGFGIDPGLEIGVETHLGCLGCLGIGR